MSDENSLHDDNRRFVMLGVTNDADLNHRMIRVDPTTGALLVDQPSGSGNNPLTPSSITEGSKVVSIAGTPETLVGTSTPCKYVFLQAYLSNTDNVAFGGSATVDPSGTGDGTLLEPGDSCTVFISNAQKIFLDAVVSGEGVRYNIFE